ncbi:MATE family efflux transporter [Streptomyces sp. RTGN2]|uniref:MATE family efflux transporter n=1 Tax=unclassified Streptomyces TaxID=2593676 RepID=UPI0025553805|nr:MATE family efflux transporter [Streptomyces sp. RTGN2]WSU59686.1 MATE family efflux transporter [Streptomyces sp. NBC_01104]
MAGPRVRLDLETTREVVRVSLPLMLGMAGNLIMMLVDRICLARYSEDTLKASGPAVFTAGTLIMVITGTVGITRSYVAQAHGRKDRDATMEEGANGLLLALILAIALLATTPLVARVPDLSGQPAHIRALESQFLTLSTSYGAVMALNMAMSSYFNGTARTRVPMTVGLIGQAVGIVVIPGLVFGRFGLPEMGMRGSAIGTLVAVGVMFAGYAICLPKGFFVSFLRLLGQGVRAITEKLWLRLRRGAPSGGGAGLDELGNTSFVWLAGVLGPVALAANNVAVSLNYVAVIPPIGLALGCNVLCGNALGAGRHDRVPHIVRVTLGVAGVYVGLIVFLQIVTPKLLLYPFGLDQVEAAAVGSAVDTSRMLWTYAIAFMFSIVATAVLDCFGLARFGFLARVVVMWGLSVPTICLITLTHRGETGLLPLVWAVYSAFEAVIAAVCFWRIRRAVAGRENALVKVAAVPEAV